MTKIQNTLTVTVTQRDIDNGRIANLHACPIALAMHRRLGQRKGTNGEIEVYSTGMSWIFNGMQFRWKASKKVREFIHKLDHSDKKPKPIQFTIRRKDVVFVRSMRYLS